MTMITGVQCTHLLVDITQALLGKGHKNTSFFFRAAKAIAWLFGCIFIASICLVISSIVSLRDDWIYEMALGLSISALYDILKTVTLYEGKNLMSYNHLLVG
jgi:hypothetical protein